MSLRAGGLLLAIVLALMWVAVGLAKTTSADPATKQTATEPIAGSKAGAEPVTGPWAETPRTLRLRNRATRLKQVARRFTKLMKRDPQSVNRSRSEFETLLAYSLWLRSAWGLRAKWARFRAHHPPHRAEWRCIHRWEGAWGDPDSPYYGGLQMDLGFQQVYGRELLRRKGTADHWAPHEQMWVAERAVKAGRGFYPWPVAAHRCGLI